jgi:FeS assembly SUF system protein
MSEAENTGQVMAEASPNRPEFNMSAIPADELERLTADIVQALKTVYDPEIPVNIYELGLIYTIEADAQSRVRVDMTLTSPACPSAQQLPSEVRYKVKAVEGVSDCTVEVVWEPPWTKEMMSETAKLTLGMF